MNEWVTKAHNPLDALTPMRLFGLAFLEPESESISYFNMRRAERLEDYLVALLVESETAEGARMVGGGEMFDQLLREVVLRHVFDVKPASVRVACYEKDTDALVLIDSAPSKRAVPKRGGLLSYTDWDDRAYELPTSDYYTVPVAQMVKQLMQACIESRWTLLECQDFSPCPALAAPAAEIKKEQQAAGSKKRVLESDSK
jgi:hypothetical protein